MNELWMEYPEIGNMLEEVNALILRSTNDADEFITEAVSSAVVSSGKMLRPAFVVLSAKFGDYDKESLLRLAAVTEMLHIATLVHDDIIDEAKLRRGIESVQSRYGKDSAVFIGDYLFAKCFTLLSEKQHNKSMEKLANAILKICRGELKQYRLRYMYDVNIMNYLKIITGKTAALFSMSFHIGAAEGNLSDRQIKTLSRIGYYCGMAFQIIDDCLDYSDKKTIKKSTMNDLKQGYLTLPVIYALGKDKDNKLKHLLETTDFNKTDMETIHDLIMSYDGLTQARQLAKKYTAKAFKLIETLPASDNRNTLEDIVKKMLHRKY
ncbi:polyprenyl synthetase family protein [Alkalibacter rhizosphaerae]|uniref:Polyprenyl synthetase family protein n=1 Tax=Alkalibacter rhizosphaerae TaxID=2815577 RepID=A0A974XFM4_9FIRM|nr:polyprenyl synthetase family protein [Alkalibacter rhizosphaerae]QSX08969.1 polyprenyl synthetase family protein [Alkalibacter rhizosphaerae]